MVDERAVRDVREKIDRLRERADAIEGTHPFDWRETGALRCEANAMETVLNRLTAGGPEGVAALVGKWREEARSLRVLKRMDGTYKAEDLRNIDKGRAAGYETCARELETALRGVEQG